jgi:hypothetical protein
MKCITLLLLNLGGLVSGLEMARPVAARPAVYHRFEAAHEPLIKDEYLVMLHDDHPLEDHFAFIGTNLSETASYFHPYSNINGYCVRVDEHTMHDRIRHDPGVRFVEHNREFNPRPDWDVETARPAKGLSPPDLERRWKVWKDWWHWVIAMSTSWGQNDKVKEDEWVIDSVCSF